MESRRQPCLGISTAFVFSSRRRVSELNFMSAKLGQFRDGRHSVCRVFVQSRENPDFFEASRFAAIEIREFLL